MVIMSSDARGLGLNILQFTRSYLGDNLQFLLRKCTHGGGRRVEGWAGGSCWMLLLSADPPIKRRLWPHWRIHHEIIKPGPGLNPLVQGAGDILQKGARREAASGRTHLSQRDESRL